MKTSASSGVHTVGGVSRLLSKGIVGILLTSAAYRQEILNFFLLYMCMYIHVYMCVQVHGGLEFILVSSL